MSYKRLFLKEYFKRSILFSVGVAHLFTSTAYVFADPCYPLPQNASQWPSEVKGQHMEVKKAISEQEQEREDISNLMNKCVNFSTGIDSYMNCAQGLSKAFNLNSRLSIESLILESVTYKMKALDVIGKNLGARFEVINKEINELNAMQIPSSLSQSSEVEGFLKKYYDIANKVHHVKNLIQEAISHFDIDYEPYYVKENFCETSLKNNITLAAVNIEPILFPACKNEIKVNPENGQCGIVSSQEFGEKEFTSHLCGKDITTLFRFASTEEGKKIYGNIYDQLNPNITSSDNIGGILGVSAVLGGISVVIASYSLGVSLGSVLSAIIPKFSYASSGELTVGFEATGAALAPTRIGLLVVIIAAIGIYFIDKWFTKEKQKEEKEELIQKHQNAQASAKNWLNSHIYHEQQLKDVSVDICKRNDIQTQLMTHNQKVSDFLNSSHGVKDILNKLKDNLTIVNNMLKTVSASKEDFMKVAREFYASEFLASIQRNVYSYKKLGEATRIFHEYISPMSLNFSKYKEKAPLNWTDHDSIAKRWKIQIDLRVAEIEALKDPVNQNDPLFGLLKDSMVAVKETLDHEVQSSKEWYSIVYGASEEDSENSGDTSAPLDEEYTFDF